MVISLHIILAVFTIQIILVGIIALIGVLHNPIETQKPTLKLEELLNERPQ